MLTPAGAHRTSRQTPSGKGPATQQTSQPVVLGELGNRVQVSKPSSIVGVTPSYPSANTGSIFASLEPLRGVRQTLSMFPAMKLSGDDPVLQSLNQGVHDLSKRLVDPKDKANLTAGDAIWTGLKPLAAGLGKKFASGATEGTQQNMKRLIRNFPENIQPVHILEATASLASVTGLLYGYSKLTPSDLSKLKIPSLSELKIPSINIHGKISPGTSFEADIEPPNPFNLHIDWGFSIKFHHEIPDKKQ